MRANIIVACVSILLVLLLSNLIEPSSASPALHISVYVYQCHHKADNSSFAHRFLPDVAPHSSASSFPLSLLLRSHRPSSSQHPSTSTSNVVGVVTPTNPPPFYPCPVPNWIVFGLNFSEPNLLPLTFGGISVGFGVFTLLSTANQAGFQSRVSYAFVFFFFGVMNFSGLILHCLTPIIKSVLVAQLCLLADGLGTSAVGFSLAVAALTDLGLLKDTGKIKLGVSILVYAALIYGWYETVFHQWARGFSVLYLMFTVVGSISYFVLQIVWLIKNGFSKGAVYLLLSFVVGMLGLQTIQNPQVAKYLCDHLPRLLASETPWFLASDLSLYFLYKYLFTRKFKEAKPSDVEAVEEGERLMSMYPQSTMESK